MLCRLHVKINRKHSATAMWILGFCCLAAAAKKAKCVWADSSRCIKWQVWFANDERGRMGRHFANHLRILLTIKVWHEFGRNLNLLPLLIPRNFDCVFYPFCFDLTALALPHGINLLFYRTFVHLFSFTMSRCFIKNVKFYKIDPCQISDGIDEKNVCG